MKKLIIFYVLIMSFSTISFSQNKEQHKERKEALIKDLNLSETQLVRFKTIRKEVHESRKANEAAFINDKKSLHKANKLLKISTEEKIKNILTPEQFAKFKSFKESRYKEKILARADSMASTLGLIAEQKEKFKLLIEERNNKIQENKKLYSSDLEKMKIANNEVRKSFKSKLATLLTPDQLTLYKSKQKAIRSQN